MNGNTVPESLLELSKTLSIEEKNILETNPALVTNTYQEIEQIEESQGTETVMKFEDIDYIFTGCKQQLADAFTKLKGMERCQIKINTLRSNELMFQAYYSEFMAFICNKYLPEFYICNNPDPAGFRNKVNSTLLSLNSLILTGKDESARSVINEKGYLIDNIYYYFLLRIAINTIQRSLPRPSVNNT